MQDFIKLAICLNNNGLRFGFHSPKPAPHHDAGDYGTLVLRSDFDILNCHFDFCPEYSRLHFELYKI
jgi:hypothetical protein